MLGEFASWIISRPFLKILRLFMADSLCVQSCGGVGIMFLKLWRNQWRSRMTGGNTVIKICFLFAIYPASWLLVSLHSCIWLYLPILCRRGKRVIGYPKEAECYSLPRHYPTFSQKQPPYLYWINLMGKWKGIQNICMWWATRYNAAEGKYDPNRVSRSNLKSMSKQSLSLRRLTLLGST